MNDRILVLNPSVIGGGQEGHYSTSFYFYAQLKKGGDYHRGIAQRPNEAITKTNAY